MPIYQNILETIGNTPVVKLQHFDTGPCELFIKLENQNPTGSIKDRIALYMIEQAEKRGDLKPGATLIEGTAGNTGLGLAMVAQRKGYQCIIVMPDKMSREKIMHLKALGAQVITTRSDVVKGDPEYYLDIAERLAHETTDAYYINQFNNPDNVRAHETQTGPEIWQDMDEQLDAFVAGMGTSGTMTGVGHYLKQVNSNIDLVLADPSGSILTDYVNHGTKGEAKGWLVEGIGEDYIPTISDIDQVDTAIAVDDKTAFATARALLLKEGILAGSSTGTLLAAALHYCRAQTKAKRVLTLACDTGNKYLSKLYNDAWLNTHDFLPTTTFGDLRDLLAYASTATVHIQASMPLVSAHKKMLEHQLSTLPVLEGHMCVGLIDSLSLCHTLQTPKLDLQQTVSTIMKRNYTSLDIHTDENTLLQKLQQCQAIILTDKQKFCGQLTALDYSHSLKRRQSHV